MRTVARAIFRATMEAWLGKFLLPLVFFLALTITAIRAAGLNQWFAAIGVGIILMIATLDYFVPMTCTWLSLDGRMIEGSINGQYVQVFWTEVVAAWIFEHQRQRHLCVGTRTGTVVIPLRFLDDNTVWKRVQSSVPAAALEESAIMRLPDYDEWKMGCDRILENSDPHTVTDHWLLQVVGWAGVTFFLLGMLASLSEMDIPSTIVFLVLVIVCGHLLAGWGITEVSGETIERNTLFHGMVIPWERVRWIEVDPLNLTIVFVGENCRLSIPGPGIWNGPEKRDAMTILLSQVERRHIPMRSTPLAFFHFSRNTRMKK